LLYVNSCMAYLLVLSGAAHKPIGPFLRSLKWSMLAGGELRAFDGAPSTARNRSSPARRRARRVPQPPPAMSSARPSCSTPIAKKRLIPVRLRGQDSTRPRSATVQDWFCGGRLSRHDGVRAEMASAEATEEQSAGGLLRVRAHGHEEEERQAEADDQIKPGAE
jgi:hypothetical protein